MKLLNDARDQPGELVHINGIDESHGFLYAVGKEECRQQAHAKLSDLIGFEVFTEADGVISKGTSMERTQSTKQTAQQQQKA